MKKLVLFLVTLPFLFTGCRSAGTAGNTEAAAAGCSCAESKASMQIVMNFERKIKPEHIAAYKEAFEVCREATLKEPGCISYTLYQSYNDETRFFLEEIWKDEAAHAFHSTTEHLRVMREATRGMADPDFRGRSVRVSICPCVNEEIQ